MCSRRALTLVLLALVVFAATDHYGFAQSAAKLVAVLELDNKAGLTDDEAYFLTNKVRSVARQLLPAGKFVIMTRENIETLLPEGMSLKNCTDAKCEIEVGRKLGAEYIVTGEILRFGGDLRIQMSVHHVPSVDFLGSRDTPAAQLSAQEPLLTAAAREIMGLVLNHAGVAAAPAPGGGAVFVQPTQPSAPAGAAELREIKPTEAPPAGASGLAGLYITSNPPGARVFLGDTEVATTSPAFQRTNLQAGTTVRVTLKLDLYHDLSFDVPLVPGIQKFENLQLKPAFGSLTIESEPTGAKVLIGGREVGTTPYSNPRQPSGNFLVTLEKEWYAPLPDQTVTVRDGEATKQTFSLSQDFGTLEVASNPSGAEVMLNGKKLGNTPASFRVPPVKNGKLEVNLPSHRGKAFEISIDRGQTVKITAEQATLVARLGSLQVVVDPPEPGAKVIVDNREVGNAPALVGDVIAGSHDVRVEAPDKVGTARVTVQEGQTVVATVTLARRFQDLWRDPATRLTWQVLPTGGEMSWEKAKSHCERLNLGGEGKWRLPTISELRSLIRGCPATQRGGSCGVTDGFSDDRSASCNGCKKSRGPGYNGAYLPPELSGSDSWFWSSSSLGTAQLVFWGVESATGRVSNRAKYRNYDIIKGIYDPTVAGVRCVR